MRKRLDAENILALAKGRGSWQRLAIQLKVTPASIHRWRQNNDIPADDRFIKAGSGILYDQQARQFIEAPSIERGKDSGASTAPTYNAALLSNVLSVFQKIVGDIEPELQRDVGMQQEFLAWYAQNVERFQGNYPLAVGTFLTERKGVEMRPGGMAGAMPAPAGVESLPPGFIPD